MIHGSVAQRQSGTLLKCGSLVQSQPVPITMENKVFVIEKAKECRGWRGLPARTVKSYWCGYLFGAISNARVYASAQEASNDAIKWNLMGCNKWSSKAYVVPAPEQPIVFIPISIQMEVDKARKDSTFGL